MGLTVGLLRMTRHAGERRDFLPRFVHRLVQLGADEVVIEEGYGEGVGVSTDVYLADGRVRVGTRDEALDQDVVLVLRCPPEEDLRRLRPGAMLVSMLHYATRPGRNQLLRERGIRAVSLDSVTDDRGRRLVENLELTAWAGLSEAFRALALGWGWFAVPTREPIRVTVLGSGALGSHAMHAATRYGDHEVRSALHRAGVPGVEVAVVDHDLSWHEAYMVGRLRVTDVLVDATFRPDPSEPAVANALLGVMPPHAVLLDLAADPYDPTRVPPGVKGIEGLPHGSLAQHVFAPEDPAWDLVPASVDATHRRTTLSCDAWPGLRPKESMERYAEQIEGVMEVIVTTRADAWDKQSPYERERAVARAELSRWEEGHRC